MSTSNKNRAGPQVDAISLILTVLIVTSIAAMSFSCIIAFSAIIDDPRIRGIISPLYPAATTTPEIVIVTASPQPTYTLSPTYTPHSGTVIVVVTSTPSSAISTEIANISGELETVRSQLEKIEGLILEDPVRALENVALRNSLKYLQKDVDGIKEDIKQLEEQGFKASLMLFGILFSLVTTALSGFVYYRRGGIKRGGLEEENST